MAKITIIDDDYATELLVERLRLLGNTVVRLTTVDDAISEIGTVVLSDLVILDIIMPPPSTDPSKISGGTVSGLIIYQKIRDLSKNVPILVLSASTSADLASLRERDEHLSYISRWNSPSLNELVERIQRLISNKTSTASLTAFIVHGHDETAKLELKNYLQNTLKFQEPIILHEQPDMGRTIIEKFEEFGQGVDFVFVLLTPDDRGKVEGSNASKRRARQNVIFEMGYFYGSLGRRSGRVILLHKGGLDLPNDIDGLIYIDISNGIDSAGERIRKEIEHGK